MSEIAKCPCCGDGPDILVDLFDKHGKYPKGYSCCGAEFAELDQWNQYAAAMELAKAVVWAGECEDQKDYMDDATSNRDAWRSIVNLDLEANDEACRALERCEEVFNG